MAWRLECAVVRGEIDCRVRGLITGKFWIAGRAGPVELALTGLPWRDLAGFLFRFQHPNPPERPTDSLDDYTRFAAEQHGAVGDFTASRKARMLSAPGAKPSSKDRMVNVLYLEWFSERNGRVVIESPDLEVKILDGPTWTMTEEDEMTQRESNQASLDSNLRKMIEKTVGPVLGNDEFNEDEEEELSPTEVAADEEAARMDELSDRIERRLAKEEDADFEQVWLEERERLRIERNEPEPEPLTPEQEADRSAWIEEMNAAAQEAAAETHWEEPERHPLVLQCTELSGRLRKQTRSQGWVDDLTSSQHPLFQLWEHVSIAGAKLAGALHSSGPDEEWPPDPLVAGNTLVRLKKARTELTAALEKLGRAEAMELGSSAWREAVRPEIQAVLDEVQALIEEVRGSLE